MKQVVFFLFIFLSLKSYCQDSNLLPPDSLLKANKVKKVLMKSTTIKGNGSGTNVYYYNKNSDLARHETLSSLTTEPFMITDYFFDSSGKRYASLMHGGESNSSYSSSRSGSSWRIISSFGDSILYYYEYNLNNQFSRVYSLYPSGKIMFEKLYIYSPKSITRRSYDEQQKLRGETVEYYEKEQYINKSISKKYDNTGGIISTFTQEFTNIYNAEGQVTEVNYRNDTCSCVSIYKYYPNGLVKSHSNISCMWNKKYTYKYYKP